MNKHFITYRQLANSLLTFANVDTPGFAVAGTLAIISRTLATQTATKNDAIACFGSNFSNFSKISISKRHGRKTATIAEGIS